MRLPKQTDRGKAQHSTQEHTIAKSQQYEVY